MAGPEGPAGPTGDRGPVGHLSSAEVQDLVELRHQLEGALKELQLQFQRIAQIQAQLDSLLFQPKREK